MALNELLTLGNNVCITLTAKDLFEVIQNTVLETRKELEQRIKDVNAEEYLTSNEVQKMLNISPVSLWRWHDIGYLCHTKIGKRNMYLKSDVTSLLSKRIVC